MNRALGLPRGQGPGDTGRMFLQLRARCRCGARTGALGDSNTSVWDDIPVLLNSILLRRPLPNFSNPITFAGVHMNHASDSLICL